MLMIGLIVMGGFPRTVKELIEQAVSELSKKNKIILISPELLQKDEDVEIKAIAIENDNIHVGRKVYFFFKEDLENGSI